LRREVDKARGKISVTPLFLAVGMLVAGGAIVIERGDAFEIAAGILLIVAALSILGGLFIGVRRDRR
jgi:hypothetical protein